jgi:hypothetical protein
MQKCFVHADWLDHPKTDANMIAVLAALTKYADRNGICWPRQSTLATLLKRSRAWVSKVLGELAKLELITWVRRTDRDGGEISCRYTLADHAKLFESRTVAPPPQDIDTNRAKPNKESLPAGKCLSRVESEPIQATEVPEGWYPTDADMAFMIHERPDLMNHMRQVGRSTRIFVSTARSKGRRYVDVSEAWRA